MTWALMVSAICWYQAIKNNGFLSWLKGFTEPIAIMTPMNIVSEIAQPVSLAFRHFGNIAGGGVITTLLYAALSAASVGILKLIGSSSVAIIAALLVAGVRLQRDLVAALPHVAPDGRVRALVAPLVHEAVEDALGRVALLVPCLAVLGEHVLDRVLVGIQHATLAMPAGLRGLGRQVLHVAVLPDGRFGDAHVPRDFRDACASPPELSYILNLVHADHPFLASSRRIPSHRLR
jgi:hypothetical protein